MPSPQTLSEQLLLQVKMHRPVAGTVAALGTLPMARLQEALSDDAQKKAFWINIYNAFFQILRREQKVGKPEIFRRRLVRIAGQAFSLDDIEHGILRRFRFKWALGYLPDPFAPAIVKKLAVSKVDPRIHFALNCGAASCPPIAFYTPDRVDQQLELATRAFLETETDLSPDKKEIRLTRLFQWYAGDFGGRRGIRRFLRDTPGIETRGHRLRFKPYDWSEKPDHFREQGD